MPHASLTILFVTGSLYQQSSGPFLSLLETTHTLHKQGQYPIVVGSKDRWREGQPQEWNPVAAYAFGKIGPYSLHYTPLLNAWLKQRGDPIQVANLQGIWLYTNHVVSRWCRKHGIPYMITVHGNFHSYALQISHWKKYIAQWWFAKAMLRHARCLHALNDAEYKAIRSYGLSNPVCIIPNGILFPDPALKTERIDLHKQICLFVGRLHPIKGIDNLLYAWKNLTALKQGWILVLVGNEDKAGYRRYLETLSLELGIQDDVYFAGPQYGQDKTRWFHSADFFVLPSHSEGWPVVVLEALAHQLPVVMTETCHIPEIQESGAAIQVKTGIEGLSEGLQQMMMKPSQERRWMGKQGYHFVQRHYQWEHVIDQLLEVYRWMLGQSPAPSSVLFN